MQPPSGGATLSVRRHPSIEEVPPSDWDAIAGRHGFYGTSEWLRQFEGPERNYVSAVPTYVVVRRGEEIVALAPCYLVRRSGRIPPHLDLRESCLGGDRSPLREEDLDPYLVCGAPVGENRMMLAPGLEAAERRTVLRRLAEEVRELAAAEGARLAAFGLVPADEAAALIAEDPSWIPAFGASDCALAVPDGGFEGYLRSLRARPARNVRADVRHFEEAGLHFETRRFGEVIDEAAPLMVIAERKWGIDLDVEWLKTAFRRMASFIDGRTRVFCARKGDTLVSWAMVFHHRDTYYCRLSGSDTAALPRHAAVYFNNLFYEPIRQAPADGVRAIHYGSGSLAAKIGHGCGVLPLVYLLSFPQPPAAEVLDAVRGQSAELLRNDRQELERSGVEPARVDEALGVPALRGLLGAGT